MKAVKNEFAVNLLLDQIKSALIVYLQSIDGIDKVSGEISKDNLYEVVDAINREPETQQPTSRGMLYNFFSAPFRAVKYFYNTISNNLHALLYKKLSDDRKKQVTYIAKLVQRVELNLNAFDTCDDIKYLAYCNELVNKELKSLVENIKKLSSTSETKEVLVTLGEDNWSLKGLKNSWTGKTSLGDLLQKNVLDKYNDDEVLQSIENLLEVNKQRIENEQEKIVSEKEKKLAQLKESVLFKVIHVKLKLDYGLVDDKVKCDQRSQEFLDAMTKRYFDYHDIEQSFQLTDVDSAQLITDLKGAIEKGNKDDILRLLPQTTQKQLKKLEDLVGEENNALMPYIKMYNKSVLFGLLRDRLELNSAFRHLFSCAGSYQDKVKEITQYMWLTGVVELLVNPLEVDVQFKNKVREMSKAQFDQISQKISQVIDQEPTSFEDKLLNNVANFFTQCLEHIRLLNWWNKGVSLLPFYDGLVLQKVAPTVKCLEEKMKAVALPSSAKKMEHN